jgi:para-nitrobenzyl esterase
MLRFRSPAAAPTWEGTRSAREFGPPCPQIGMGEGAPALFGGEDCLTLNVHVPAGAAQKLPVLVWINGGGRRVGDARRDVSAFVRDTGSIVVAIQYRLDHLAFLAHPALTQEDPARLASGNYGFEDAIAALKWVRNEVAAFGGDPERVTIAGLSGGGTMVCGLMVSPRAAGLFQRAIVQSGGGCWFPTEPIEVGERRGVRAAAELGCVAPGDAATCLRAQRISAFFKAGSLVDNPFPQGSFEWFGAQPLLGGRSGHLVDGYVFPRSWPSAFEAGAFQRVPTMIGVTEHEGRRVYAELLYGMGAPVVDAASYPRALRGLTGSEALGKATARRFPLGPGNGTPAERFADVARCQGSASDAHARATCGGNDIARLRGELHARREPKWGSPPLLARSCSRDR